MRPRLAKALPRLTREVRRLLRRGGHEDLVPQLARVGLLARCDCGASWCASIETAPLPKGAWGPGYRTLPVSEGGEGIIILDLLHDQVVGIEVLFRDDLRAELEVAIHA